MSLFSVDMLIREMLMDRDLRRYAQRNLHRHQPQLIRFFEEFAGWSSR